MISEKLKYVAVDRSLLDHLYSNKSITAEGREYGLNLLYQHDILGERLYKLFVVLGAILALVGIAFFFAFNWKEIQPLDKLAFIEFGIILSITGAYSLSLNHIVGKLFLLSASVLVGVFMAVFGQIYQTGADSYQLFMIWSFLIFGWTIISNFAAQWILWLFITNIFIALWYDAGVQTVGIFCIVMAVLNGAILILSGYLKKRRGFEWLDLEWVCVALSIFTAFYLLRAVLDSDINSGNGINFYQRFINLLSIVGHTAMCYYFMRLNRSFKALTVSVLSFCIILEYMSYSVLYVTPLTFLSPDVQIYMILMTLAIFSAAIVFLKNAAKVMRGNE